MFTGKVTTLPFYHTSEPDKPNANFGSSAAFKTALDSSTIAIQGEANSLIDQLNSTTPGSSGSESMGSAAISGVAGATPFAQMTDLKAQIVGMSLGLIPDGTLTLAKMTTSLQNQINQTISLEREIANLKAASTIANRVDGASGTFYDLNDGLNGGSAGKIDNTKTNSTGTIAISAGTIVVPVLATTGFAVGQEVTIFDDVSLERRIITAINAGVSLSFAAMTNSYKIKAQICRSSVIQDTINHLLKFNGWTYLTTYTNTAVNVVAAAYDTSGNGGRKIVYLSNGWLVSVVVNASAAYFYKSTDNGVTWTQLCFTTGITVSAGYLAIASSGTLVYSIYASAAASGPSCLKFDATTVSNVGLSATSQVTNAESSLGSGLSLAVAPNGAITATWCSKNATYPNSNNIRSAKSVDGGVTWTKQDGTAGVDQVTNDNTTGTDSTNPCVVYRSNNIPLIFTQLAISTTSYLIRGYYWNVTLFSVQNVYNGTTYSQSNPCASVAPSGRIWCAWYGLDATDTTAFNIRYSYSDDGGATWLTAVKLTSGNTYSQQYPTLSIDKNNNVYILWNAPDAVSSGFLNVFRNIWTGSAFTGATKLTTNTTAHALQPEAIDNNTMDFNLLTPPMIYKDSQAVAVKFSGTYIASTTTPVLVEEVRYNINPPSNVSSAVAWVDHDADANYSIAGAISFQAGGGNESFANMTKTTAAIDGTHNEDQFVGSGTSAAKATLRLTLTRNSTGLVKNIQDILGAVGA